MRPKGEDVENQLREKVEQAEASYRRATDEYNRLMSISTDTSSLDDLGLVEDARRHALVIQEQARLIYDQALKTFNDFILHGKVPPTDPSA